MQAPNKRIDILAHTQTHRKTNQANFTKKN